MNFCHLHNHNTYSLLDGLGSPDQFAQKANKLNHEYLGITNHGSTDGLISFQKSCLKNDILPISGVEFYIVPNGVEKKKGEKRGHITVWIKNDEGYHNVLRMLTIANLDFFYYRPRIDYETLLSHCEGLCIGTACSASFLNIDGGIDFLKKLYKKMGNDLYLEIMPHHYQQQIDTNTLCLDLHKKHKIKLIATNDAHYVNEENAENHEVLLACQTKKKWNDPNRWKFSVDGLFLCDSDYLREKFKNQGCVPDDVVVESMENTVEIAEKCKDFRITKKEIILPIPPQYEGMDEEKLIRDFCEEGFKEKVSEVTEEYRKRFEFELDVLKDFKVIRYFLIVQDIVNWSEKNGIMIGPGRGSAAGCLISYLLGITKVDPIKHGLLFERFLNPGRKGSLPDIDLDVEDVKRVDVVERLKTLYGKSNVAGITTFLKIEDKAAIKDVARVFDVPFGEVNLYTKTINDGIEASLQTNDGKNFQNRYPEVIEHALAIRGQIKAYGRHAAASIVSPVNLSKGTISYLADRSNQLVVGLDGTDAEDQGLVKLDLLGLSTMTVISMAVGLVKKNHGKSIDPTKIPLDDSKIYEEISNGKTVGCFQIGTYSLTSLIKQMGVDDIYSLSDAVALVRPGAMDSGATAKYIERKKGEDWDKKHPVYEEITKKTYGIICYQEQIIQVINKIAGLPLSVADQIRKIIGKKRDPKLFEKYKNAFINGCLEKGTFNQRDAEDFWEELGHHASYSFNYSHSLSYSIITYWTAWLKHHYPTEFICASLTYGAEAQKKNLIKEAQRLNLNIVPPKIGKSDTHSWTADKENLYVPFVEVAGIGPKAADTIKKYAESKKGGFFSSEEAPVIKGKLKKILEEIGAFGEKPTGDLDSYLDLGFSFDHKKAYKNLYKLVGENCEDNVIDLLSGDVKNKFLVKSVINRNPIKKDLTKCTKCGLINHCKAPVPMKIGSYNIMIVDEYPGWKEDKKRQQMVGDAAEKVLFPELEKYGFEKTDFCLSSIVKCQTKKPCLDTVKACSGWLKKEIKLIKPFVLLVFGNTGIKWLDGEEFGIQKKNGLTEWREDLGCWVCYCVSPISALFHVDAKENFEVGIKNFVKKLEDLGGFE